MKPETEKRYQLHSAFANIATLIILGLLIMQQWVVIGQNTREQVTIIGTFQPSLKEATKMTLLPETAGNPMPTGNQPLSKVETSIEIKIEPEPISPIQAELNESKNLYRNHLNLGIGTNLNPVFDFLHHSELSKSVGLNIQALHRSSWTDVRDYAPSDWMNNKARISADINIGEQTILTGFTYSFDRFHWYGFKPEDYPAFDGNGKSILQHLNIISADALWSTKFRDPESINHYLGLDLDFFNDRYRAFEHAFAIKGGANKNMELFSIDGTQYARIDAELAYTAEGDSTMEKSTLLIHGRPAAGLRGSFYELEAGLALSSAQAEKTYFHLLPELSGSLYIFQDRMRIFASFGGKIEHNTRRSLLAENPYLRSIDSSFITLIPGVFRAGIKGNPMKGLEIRFAYEHMTAEQMGFFVKDTTSAFEHMYQTIFDDISRNRFTAEVRFDHGNKVRAELIVHVDNYDMTSLAQPWHLPKVQTRFNGWYDLTDKLRLKSGVLVMSSRYATAAGGNVQKLKDVTDIKLGTEYQYNQQLWFYADVANLLNQRYFRFDGYPVQGAQLTAGMKLNF